MAAKWKLATRSKEVRKDVHKDLKKIIDKYLEVGPLDVSLTEGLRTEAQQFGYWKRGRHFRNNTWIVVNKGDVITYADGKEKKSKHQSGEAFDFRVVGHKYERNHMLIAISAFLAIAEMLWEAGEIDHVLRSGANWDMDSTWLRDQNFKDLPHLELVGKPRLSVKKTAPKPAAPKKAPVKKAEPKKTAVKQPVKKSVKKKGK